MKFIRENEELKTNLDNKITTVWRKLELSREEGKKNFDEKRKLNEIWDNILNYENKIMNEISMMSNDFRNQIDNKFKNMEENEKKIKELESKLLIKNMEIKNMEIKKMEKESKDKNKKIDYQKELNELKKEKENIEISIKNIFKNMAGEEFEDMWNDYLDSQTEYHENVNKKRDVVSLILCFQQD